MNQKIMIFAVFSLL